MPEWLNGLVLKTKDLQRVRGFESYSLRGGGGDVGCLWVKRGFEQVKWVTFYKSVYSVSKERVK